MQDKKKVTVFSTPTCPYCVQAKQYLTENKIDFVDIDVSVDQKSAQKMFDRSHHMGVPQLWINDEVVIGFDIERINDLLNL